MEDINRVIKGIAEKHDYIKELENMLPNYDKAITILIKDDEDETEINYVTCSSLMVYEAMGILEYAKQILYEGTIVDE